MGIGADVRHASLRTRAGTLAGRTVPVIPDESMKRLKSYRWPGNIRELRNIIERAMILCSGEQIHASDLPLGKEGVAGYAIDVEDQEEARAELVRFVRAQRDMLDRLSAGVAQFGRDRSLIFFNQPFARLFSLPGDFLADLRDRERERPLVGVERLGALGVMLGRLDAAAVGRRVDIRHAAPDTNVG